MKKIILSLFFVMLTLKANAIYEPPEFSSFDDEKFKQQIENKFSKKSKTENANNIYKKCTEEPLIIESLELLKGTAGEFSRNAILGDNLSGKPVRIEFADLSTINVSYTNFDALGWKKKDRLYIYINRKHHDAPKEALAAVLAHEAIHQDELNSLNEETYAWTLEAVVWQQMLEINPQVSNMSHPLVDREKLINKLFVRGNYTNEFIRKSVISNTGYQNLPERSPGFEELL